MFNVMLTTFCNQPCPYCFARERLAGPGNPRPSDPGAPGREISLKNVETLIRLFKKWGVNPFSLIGGEPTLHSRFKQILERLLVKGFAVHIYTNGIIKKETVDFLSRQKGVSYLLNHNSPAFYRSLCPDPTPLIDYFLSRCGKNIILGANIYRKEFDGAFLTEKVKRYGLPKRVRIGFANPICSIGSPAANAYLRLEEYGKVIPPLMAFSRACDREGIQLDIDCVAPLCAFTREDYGELCYNVGTVPAAACRPVIDIGVDLRVWRCFVTSGMYNDRKITSFQNAQEMVDYFDRKFWKFQKIGGMDKCLDCKYMKRGQCQGGCLGHTLNAFTKAAQKESPR
jgi:radical SAM protein with 4Fe4S-binding SPASM domain